MTSLPRWAAIALVLLVGTALTLLALRAGGYLAGASASIAVVLALVVAVRATRGEDSTARHELGIALEDGLALLPGALTVYLSFNAGGFFPQTPALLALGLALLLLVRTALAERPFAGFSRALGLGVIPLGLYAAWTLASASWSGAPIRALVELDRVLLYLLALVLFGSLVHTPARIRLMLRGLALGIVLVCLAGLITRLLPDLWANPSDFAATRLRYPITYWNALGLLASLGTIFCLHLASDGREPRTVRVLGAAAVPLLCVTLLFTLSRGAILAGIAGLLLYLVWARPRALASGALATVPATAIALAAALDADRLFSTDPTSAAAVAQGHSAAIVIGLCAAGTGLLRLLLLPADARLAEFRLPARVRRPVLGATLVIGVITATALATALDLPARAGAAYQQLVRSADPADPPAKQSAERLTQTNIPGRIDHWRVAMGSFATAPLAGLGAGTFELTWLRERSRTAPARDAHSLYLEVLSELGVVGLVLLAVALATLLYGFARHARGPDRAPYAALLAAGLAWAIHAGIDWDWEMPAVTLWLFCIGGAVLASPPADRTPRSQGPPLHELRNWTLRTGMMIGLLIASIGPTLVWLSQQRLDASIAAFKEGDCDRATAEARASLAVLGTRPEPYEIIGFCAARAGSGGQAIDAMRSAVKRDPQNWELRYGLALVRGAARRDPRRAARTALRLNPREPLARDAVMYFDTTNPRFWQISARVAPLPRSLTP